MNRSGRTLSLVLLSCAVVLALVDSAWAQSPVRPGERMMFFYQAPDFVIVEDLLDHLDEPPISTDRDKRPPIVGFLAGVMMTYPEKVAAILNRRKYGRIGQYTVLPALALAGQKERALALAEEFGVPPKGIESLGRVRASLSAINISNADDLDILWGAFAATGEIAHVEKIIAFADAASDHGISERDVIEGAAWTINGQKGKPSDAARRLAQDSKPLAIRLILSSTALWALASNAESHPRIADYLKKSILGSPVHAKSKIRRWALFRAVFPETIVSLKDVDRNFGIMLMTVNDIERTEPHLSQFDFRSITEFVARELDRDAKNAILPVVYVKACRGALRLDLRVPDGTVRKLIESRFDQVAGQSSIRALPVPLTAELIDQSGPYAYTIHGTLCGEDIAPTSNGFFVY